MNFPTRRAAIALVIVLGACTNPYAKFYEPAVPEAKLAENYVTDTMPLRIYSTPDLQKGGLELLRQGYAMIGRSDFNGNMSAKHESAMRAQAARVGAQVVLVSSKYTGTLTSAVPLTIPQTTTTVSSGTATATGPGGTATAYGTGTSTTYGSRTLMMPVQTNRADYHAVYYAKTKIRVGLYVIALDDTTRQRLQTNHGARVQLVVEHSPAFDADILPGDIVLRVDSVRVTSAEHLLQMFAAHRGQQMDLTLDRAGTMLTKSLKVLP